MTVSVTSLGAARNVTGSRHLLEADGLRLLIDCGLYQEREFEGRNWEAFPVPPASIHAVLLTHAHIDHCGWLPRLVSQGFAGRVWCTHATGEIVPIILADAARLQGEDVETKNKRHASEGRQSGPAAPAVPRAPAALYDQADVDVATKRLQTVDFSRATEVAPGARATWLPAGHILGAAMILVEVAGKRVLFSGDLGRWDRPLVPDPSDPPAADLVLVESTYGDRLHTSEGDIPSQLERIIGGTIAQGGVVLIPSFAIERAQELLWYLHRLHEAGRIPEVPVFLDSPMAVKMLEVFHRHPEALDEDARRGFALDSLKLTRTRDESKAINDHRGSAVIIAGSGMLNGGRIKHHLNQRIDDPASCLLFVGYQVNGTLGRQLVDGARRVRLLGREREVRIRVEQVQGFSGHADRDEVLGWLSRMSPKPKKVAVIHGGDQVAPAFAKLVQERLGVPAHASDYRERIEVP